MRRGAQTAYGLQATSELLRRCHEDGDMAAREELVARFTPLAQQLVRRYERPGGEPREDLQQVALVGLIKAIDRFDRDRGFAFATFAAPTILGELRRYFRDTTWRVHVSRSLQESIQAVENAITAVQEQLGHPPTPIEVAEHSGMTEEQVLEAMAALHDTRTTSLDAPARADDGEAVDALIDTMGHVDPHFALVDYGASAGRAFARLRPRDRYILHLRFVEDLTQSEIGARVGLSQMQVSRILAQAAMALRAAASCSS